MTPSPHSVTIVIPAFNAASTIARTLEALAGIPAGWEVVVVDDHSTDGTADVARRAGVRVITSRGWRSCSAARNTGVREARGEFVVFLDSDIVARPAAIERAVEILVRTGASGLFGVYDRGEHLDNLFSRFKNYWIRHSTLHAPRPLDWVNTSLTVVRRRDLARVGGLDDALTTLRGGCDLDLGRRLAERCGPVAVEPSVEVSHLKRFTLARLIGNDFRRSRGWLRLALERRRLASAVRRVGMANVGPSFIGGAFLAAVGAMLVVLAVIDPRLAAPAAVALLVHPVVNRRFLVEAARERIRGWPAFPAVLWVDQLVCACGLAIELASWTVTGRLLRPAPVIGQEVVRPEHQ